MFSLETYLLLACALNACFPLSPVHCQHKRPASLHSVPLNLKGIFYDYVVIDGKRFHASRAVSTQRSSLVHVRIPGQVTVHAVHLSEGRGQNNQPHNIPTLSCLTRPPKGENQPTVMGQRTVAQGWIVTM